MQATFCQLGARENYQIPRALKRNGHLHSVVTDLWCGHRYLACRRLLGRYHSDLKDTNIAHNNICSITFRSIEQALKLKRWERIYRENQRFQSHASRYLVRLHEHGQGPFIVCAYSYSAWKPFLTARSLGWPTVLFQIDPGPIEDSIVRTLHQRYYPNSSYEGPNLLYWTRWREELQNSDRIVVNSDWSRNCLVDYGVNEKKIRTIQLVQDNSHQGNFELRGHRRRSRLYSNDDPLRLLFLGQVNSRKGIHAILEAAERLIDRPVEFDIAGEVQISIEPRYLRLSNVRFHGQIRRSRVDDFYKNADVFLFPTHSDGFGITQLEARSWLLPGIVSRNCASVTVNGNDGLVIDEVTGDEICKAVETILSQPNLLQKMSDNLSVRKDFSRADFDTALLSLIDELQ